MPPDRVARLAATLRDPATFWRHHPVPTLAADSPLYKPQGGYWLGSTWAPTNCMVAKGFQRAGRLDLAREVALRHLTAMAEVYRETGVLWENYCAERSARGSISMRDYSWTAANPLALLLETVLGLEPDAPANRLRWTPPPEAVRVNRYPLGRCTLTLDRKVDGTVGVRSDLPFTLELAGPSGTRIVPCPAGATAVPPV